MAFLFKRELSLSSVAPGVAQGMNQDHVISASHAQTVAIARRAGWPSSWTPLRVPTAGRDERWTLR